MQATCLGNGVFCFLWRTNLFNRSPRWFGWIDDSEVSAGFSFEGRRVFSQDVLGGGWRLEWLAVGIFCWDYIPPGKWTAVENPKSWEFGWKMMFIFNWMIFRFQPVIFTEGLRDVTKVEIWHSWKKFWNIEFLVERRSERKWGCDHLLYLFVWLVEGSLFFHEKTSQQNLRWVGLVDF